MDLFVLPEVHYKFFLLLTSVLEGEGGEEGGAVSNRAKQMLSASASLRLLWRVGGTGLCSW